MKTFNFPSGPFWGPHRAIKLNQPYNTPQQAAADLYNMTKKQKFESVANAMEVKQRATVTNGYSDGETYHAISDKTHDDVRDQLLGIISYLNGKMDTRYDIIADACKEISEMNDDDMHDFPSWNGEYASVYTNTRLSYLNNDNESEVADILKEYDCDIQTACAVWYDQQVQNAIESLIAYIQS